jgi:hypothetical protein
MRYINHMAQHGIPAEMRLRRRGDRWRVLEDESQLLDNGHGSPLSPVSTKRRSKVSSSSSQIPQQIEEVDESNNAKGANDELFSSSFRSQQNGVKPNDKKMLVFAFYAAWVTSGHVRAHRQKAFLDRKQAKNTKESI